MIKLTGIGTRALPVIFQDFTVCLDFSWDSKGNWSSVTAWKEYPNGKLEVACKKISKLVINKYLKLSKGIHGEPGQSVWAFLPEFDGIWVNI